MKKLLTIFLAASLLLVACGKDKEEKKETTKQEATVTDEQKSVKSVEVAEVKTREMSKLFDSSAVWEPLAKVDFSTDKGGTVKKIFKKNGEFVKKGEVIVKLSDAQTEADFLQAKANYQSATSNYNIARNNYQKFKTLYDKQLISYLEFSNYEATFTSAQGNLEVAKAAYMNAQDSYGYTAKITELNPIADNTTKNFKVKLTLDNPDKEIKDGMFGNVVIPVGQSSVLSIEDEAIVTRDLVNYVFKYENGKVKQVEVKVGATNLPYTEISSPEIKEGDKIVVKGLFGLQDNDNVKIKNEVNK